MIKPDPALAAERFGDGVSVVTGEVDSRATFEALRVRDARLVVANDEDIVNSNVALAVRDLSPDVPIVATASLEDSVDVLQLGGSSHVLPLRQWLGEHLANRVNAGHAQAHIIGSYRDLLIAELPVHGTPLAGKALRETGLRERYNLNFVGFWMRGRLEPAKPDTLLTDQSIGVIVGTRAQLRQLDEAVAGYNVNPNPVVVIGGGKVGRSAARALRSRGVPVHLIERCPEMREKIRGFADKLFLGDAADRSVMTSAGLDTAPAVILTAHDDAMNIYLALYCRRLNPDLHIVSRITHERNLEAIHRAGADFALSYASLGVRTILSILEGRGLVVLGEGFDVFHVPVPAALTGRTLGQSAIGQRTGLTVIAIERDGQLVASPSARTPLTVGSALLMVGTPAQRRDFTAHHGGGPPLVAYVSAAVRLCEAARAAGLDLRGAYLRLVGEPVTAGRLAAIRRTGVVALPDYGAVDVGIIGSSCRAPEAPDEVHLYDDLLAVLQAGDHAPGSGLPPATLLFSSLRSTAPFVLLNVSVGDQATVTRRACGCPLEGLGWSQHLHTIQSFEKLTAGGMTVLDADVIRILEELLPARFGGAPADYQLIEDQAAPDGSRLRLLVHPRLGPVDAIAVTRLFLETLGADSPSGRVMGLAWNGSGVLRVERQTPLATGSGKILHVHVERPAGSESGRPGPAP